jgi:two-component system CheB/CheR fusion protein
MTRAPSYDQPTDLVRLSAELAAIVESCDDAIISKDLNGTIRSWNQGAERLFGYTADEAIGQSVMMLIPEERAEEEPEIVDRLRRGERIDHFESVRIAKDGRRIHVSLTISPVRDAAGRIVGASKVARDISDRILAAEALREKDRQFRVMIDALPIAIYTTDAAGRLTHFNPAAVEFSGRVPELGTDHWCVSWKLFHPDGTPLAHDQCPMAIALKEGRAVRGEEAIAELPDGTRRWFEPFPTPLFDANGKLVGGINMLLDITERRRTEAVLREADQRKDEFLAMLAHELRNPLAPIRNSLQILRESAADREVVDRVRAIMDRQVSHMVRLVDDLMEVARITRDKIELRKERIGLDEVVRSAVETSQPLIDAFGHRLEISLPAEPLTLEADPIRIAQVLANLLNNAAKYTEPGGQIRLVAKREGSVVSISVRDDGVGIAVDMLDKVFDLFRQVGQPLERTQGGLGIGLTLVKRLVEMHGGTIQASSGGVGHGAEFVVRLPLTGRLSDAKQTPPLRSTAISRWRILVVDDHQDSANSMGALLKLSGADVRTAYDGETALEAIRSYRPSIVLLDIGLPGMNGYEVARQAREQSEGRHLTLIALTGWGAEDSVRRSREAGIDHHLVKPVDHHALIDLLSSLPRVADDGADARD